MAYLRTLAIPSAAVKFLLIALVAVSALVSWLTVRNSLGVTLAQRPPRMEVAQIAVALAPDYGFSHFAAGTALESTFLPEDMERSLSEFEKAAALSPHDFRLWLRLAQSYERSGDEDRANMAFRRALELAPNYSQVQWAAGNFLLRRGEYEEGFGHLRSAAGSEPPLAPAAAAVAWNLFDGDLGVVERRFGGSDSLMAGLAVHLAGQGRFDDALRIWAAIDRERRQGPLRQMEDGIRARLLEKGRYALILRMDRLAGLDERGLGTVANGDFDGSVKLVNAARFDWQIAEGSDAQIGIDTQQLRGGVVQKALAIVFNSDARTFRGVSQLVPIQSGKRYILSVAYRTDLESRATLKWVVVDSASSKVIAETAPVPEKSDWAVLKAEFTVPEDSEGVTVSLVRTDCPYLICPIIGRVWFDDVRISEQ